MEKDIVILGAGIAGIAANYYAGKDKAIIYEKESSYGGLCGSFKIDKFVFDKCIHMSFTKSIEVRRIFDQIKYNSIEPNPKSIYKYIWAKHPIQNNMVNFPVEEKVRAIIDFINKDKRDIEINDYSSWLYANYGQYITEEFFLKYTKKYWCEEAKDMNTSWIDNRVYTPKLEEVLYGAMSEDTPNTYYAKVMRYPINGGYQEFLKPMLSNCNILLNSEAKLIDIENKVVEFKNGEKIKFKYLVSTIPLPELVLITKDIDEKILTKSKELKATSVKLVSLVIKGDLNFSEIWFYIYDEGVLPARAYLPGKKSLNNIVNGYSTIQFEIYYSHNKPITISDEKILDNIYEFIEKSKLSCRKDVVTSDIRDLRYANIIFYKDTISIRDFIIDFYEKNNVYCAGRFGQWDYFWSDQSLLSGKNAIDKIMSKGEGQD